MRTTLDLPDSLFKRAKIAAAEQEITLKALFTQALAKELKIANPAPPANLSSSSEPKYSTLPIPSSAVPQAETKKQASSIAQAIDEEGKETPPWLL